MEPIHHHRPWSTLSIELLELILDHLSLADHIRFSAVCKSWKNVTCHFQALRSPWLVFPQSLPTSTWGFFSLMQGQVHHLHLPSAQDCRLFGCSMGWLMMTDKIYVHGNNHLVNPFTNQQIQLPNSSTIPNETVHGVHSAWIIYGVASSSPSPENVACRNCILVALSNLATLVYCRPGDTEWSLLENRYEDRGPRDFIFFKGLLYCVSPKHEVRVYEFSPRPICKYAYTSMDPVMTHDGSCDETLYLVESGGKIFMVIKYRETLPSYSPTEHEVNYESDDYYAIEEHYELDGVSDVATSFGVYMLDPSIPAWVKVRSLGDEILLLDWSCARCVNIRKLRGSKFKPNCIYFTNGKYDDYDWSEFCLEDEKIKPFTADGYPSSVNEFCWLTFDS